MRCSRSCCGEIVGVDCIVVVGGWGVVVVFVVVGLGLVLEVEVAVVLWLSVVVVALGVTGNCATSCRRRSGGRCC